MFCSVYRSSRREFTYIYLARGHRPEELPPDLLAAFGPPVHLIDLELSPQRKLATEDVEVVLANLTERGFHLQLPPGDPGWSPA